MRSSEIVPKIVRDFIETMLHEILLRLAGLPNLVLVMVIKKDQPSFLLVCFNTIITTPSTRFNFVLIPVPVFKTF